MKTTKVTFDLNAYLSNLLKNFIKHLRLFHNMLRTEFLQTTNKVFNVKILFWPDAT